jgi:acetyltransferase-like isoleucine patch superfamily enzyme
MSSPFPENPYHPMCWIIGEPAIGEGTWIGPFTVIDGSGGLTIGSGCDIGPGAKIYTHSSARRCLSGRAFNEIEREPTVIGDRVFIGTNAVIFAGVTVGDESLINPGSVVMSDVPPRTVVSGVPARPVGTVALGGADNPRPEFMPLRRGA